MHAPQVPPLQTESVPHGVPSGWAVPVSVHAEVPEAHDVTPVWHLLVGVHPRPALHAVHAPPLQTMLVPHVVPSVALEPVSTQAGPAEHEVLPV